jgi:hypothetical protein
MKAKAKQAIDYSSIFNINRLINIDWYMIDIDTHRLSISSIKYAGYNTSYSHQLLWFKF